MLLHYLGETGNPDIVSFHLNAACFFTKKRTKHSLKHHLVRTEPPFTVKRSTGCTRQDLGREHSILLSVTYMLCVNQVCHGVSRCVKDGSCFSSNLEWKLIDNSLSQQMLDAIKNITDDNFFFQEDSAQVDCVCNTIQLSENVIFAFPRFAR